MDVFINDNIKGLYDEMFDKHPHIHDVVKHRAKADGVEGDGIYSWLLSIDSSEWESLLKEIEMVSRKSLIRLTKDAVKEGVILK